MTLDLKKALRAAAVGFPIMIAIQLVFQLVGFGASKGWIEIVGFAAAWAILYGLVTSIRTRKKA